MDITYKTRSFYPDELRILRTLKTRKEKESNWKIKAYHFFIAGLIGAVSAYITSIIPESFWTFLFGTISVIAFSTMLFLPSEIYRIKRERKFFLQQITTFINKGTVDICHIKAQRIAFAPEYEDESDLYIIELNNEELLYLWDIEYNLNKKFPCLDFEIYEDDFFKLVGRQVYPLSEKIQPTKIDRKAKWNYMTQYRTPENLEIEKDNFDELLIKYKNNA